VPAVAARFAPPIGISSLGMFGAGGWGIPLSPMTLMVTVGGIVRRPAVVDDALVEHELLPLTLSFDHAVVDGAPAARFAATLIGCSKPQWHSTTRARLSDDRGHEQLQLSN
jgi:hypothetical protein